jgi:hypothetical protein
MNTHYKLLFDIILVYKNKFSNTWGACRSRALTYSERSHCSLCYARPRAMISNILIPRPPTRLHVRRVIGTAVTALSVMSYKMGQKNFYRTLAAMTDGQLLAALEAGSIELSISGATPPAHQPTLPAPQPTSTHLAAPRGNLRSQPASTASQPTQPARERSEPASAATASEPA